MIKCWVQELLGYHFTVIHRKEKMMKDVNNLIRQFRPSYALQLSISFIFHQVDRINRPQAYSYDYFKENATVRIKPTAEAELLPILVLTIAVIRECTRNTVTNLTMFSTPSPFPLFHIQSSPVLIISLPLNPIPSIATIPPKNFKKIEAIEATKMRLLCVNDITCSVCTWFHARSLSQSFGKLLTYSHLLKH